MYYEHPTSLKPQKVRNIERRYSRNIYNIHVLALVIHNTRCSSYYIIFCHIEMCHGDFFLQGVAKFDSGYGRGPRTHTELPHREVVVLHNLFYRVSFLLRQHIRCVDHHYVSRTGRGRTTRWRN